MQLLVSVNLRDIGWSLLKQKSPRGSQDELFNK